MTTRPSIRLPRGACDTHFHVFGPQTRFPYAANRAYTPAAEAPKEKLFELHAFLGIERGVVVQPAAHGFDNSAASDLIAAKRDRYVGVALLPATAETTELRRLDAQGFRGVRFNYMKRLGKGTPISEVIEFSRKLVALGWHLQIHMESALIEGMSAALRRSPVPVVIDHMGRVDASLGLDQAPFKALVSLLQNKNFYIKLSGSERISRQPPPWKDAIPFARRLAAEFGDRVFWGTDWPHPNLDTIPDDGVLVDLIAEIAPSAPQRQALLVDNPGRFYGFKG